MFQIKSFSFSPVEENTYVLYNESLDAIIIDPGCYFTEEEETLQEFIKSNKLKPKLLINTHCHLDHVFGNQWVHKQYKLDLHIHPADEELLKNAPESGKKFGLEFTGYVGPLHYLKEDQIIKLGDDELKVIHTPGHSPGSVSFYCPKQDFIISGDVLFRESIGRADLPGGSFDVLIKSIRGKLFVLPKKTVVYSGHGPSTTILHEWDHNPYTGQHNRPSNH